jgi:hypothetical protein
MTNEQWMQLYLQAWVEIGCSYNNRVNFRYWANLQYMPTRMAVWWTSPTKGHLNFF